MKKLKMKTSLLRAIPFCFILLLSSQRVLAENPVYTTIETAKTNPDFKIQGEYEGVIESEGVTIGLQIIADGDGDYSAVSYLHGLPGTSDKVEIIERTKSQRADGKITFQGADASGVVNDGTVHINYQGQTIATLQKQNRTSPTLGQKPPEGAIVLFAGNQADVEHWENGRVDSGLLLQGTTSKAKFGDHHLHIEFQLPFKPEDRGQARGNSGLYLQGRYEVQMLDSFGLSGKHNECGGIYSIKAPDTNMCFPPLSWQTYDVEFTAAKYDSDGKMTAHPRMTVKHNGVIIHDDVELPKSTTAAPLKPGPDDGPIFLQNHGNPVQYRNIWVVEK